MPSVNTVFQIVVDGIRDTICAIVVASNPNFFNLVQCLTDGNGGKPLVTGNLVGVDLKSGALVMVDANTPANQAKQANQWTVSADCVVCTPEWPNLTKKYVFRALPGTVTA